MCVLMVACSAVDAVLRMLVLVYTFVYCEMKYLSFLFFIVVMGEVMYIEGNYLVI